MKNKHQYIFVYQTINEVNGKSYVGIHATNNLNDGYIGCGICSQAHATNNQIFHKAVRKYGYASFSRHILSFYDTYAEAVQEEKFIVDTAWVKKDSNYNMALGGRGYMLASLSSEEISNKYKGIKNHRFGKKAENRRPILQYDLDGTFIREYESLSLAQSLTNINSPIHNVCIGKYTQSGGFVFRYKHYTKEEEGKLENNLKKRKRIYNKEGKWVMDSTKTDRSKIVGKRKKWKHSEETKIKLSLSRLGKKRSPCSDETKQKIGDANRGKKYTDEQKETFRKAQSKYKKPIIRFDLSGNKISEYESLRDAAKNGFDRWAIKKNIDGKSRHHKQYVFKYKEVDNGC